MRRSIFERNHPYHRSAPEPPWPPYQGISGGAFPRQALQLEGFDANHTVGALLLITMAQLTDRADSGGCAVRLEVSMFPVILASMRTLAAACPGGIGFAPKTNIQYFCDVISCPPKLLRPNPR